MLDETTKPRLGRLLSEAGGAWQQALRDELTRREAPYLGAGSDLLVQISTAGISQSLLVERMGLSKQAVQQTLDQLERAGLVRRDPDPVDRRAKYVVLTEAGRLAIEARHAAERTVEREWRAQMGRKSFEKFRKTLRKLALPA